MLTINGIKEICKEPQFTVEVIFANKLALGKNPDIQCLRAFLDLVIASKGSWTCNCYWFGTFNDTDPQGEKPSSPWVFPWQGSLMRYCACDRPLAPFLSRPFPFSIVLSYLLDTVSSRCLSLS